MQDPVTRLRLETLVRDIPDFPSPGILFKDITPILADPIAVREIVDRFAEFSRERQPDVVVGIESRGFIFGMPLALELGLPFVPVRKVGKLPWKTVREEYALEYGTSVLEIHADAIAPGERAIVVDDLLATGGTAGAAKRLIERLGGHAVGFCFAIELAFLHGKLTLPQDDVLSLMTVD
jgi:adenine phosphoribosyltransferase